MNVFRDDIERGNIASKADLKRLFRNLALKLHPDVCLDEDTAERFLKLKRDYDRTLREERWTSAPEQTDRKFSFDRCAELFGELVAGNFPADRRVRTTNRMYKRRVQRLNEEIGLLGGDCVDLFSRVEAELLELRGDSVVNNHSFNLVKIYFCNLYDSFLSRHAFSKSYVRKSYPLIIDVLTEKGCAATTQFIDLMLRGV